MSAILRLHLSQALKGQVEALEQLLREKGAAEEAPLAAGWKAAL